jgi:hypothetical protein
MIEPCDRYTTNRKPRRCPNCSSKKIARILYGPSHFYPQLRDEIETGRVVLKACCLKGPLPAWECGFCGMQIYKETELEEMSLF